MDKEYKKSCNLWKYSKKQDKFSENVYYQQNMNYHYLDIVSQVKKSIYLGEYYLEMNTRDKTRKKDKDGLSFSFCIHLIHYATKKEKTYYHPRKEIIKNWYLSLRRFCLWIEFDKYYQILQIISNGTSSIGYKIKALNEKDSKIYFAKAIDCTKNPMKKILNEIKINQTLKHESIPEYHGAFFENNKFILIFEYIDGINLQDYINVHGKLPENKVAVIIEDLLDVLNYMHHNEYVHREINLKNILICDNGLNLAAKLINFRRTQKIKDAESSKAFLTLEFIAPEVLKGDSHNAKSDIYGLGILLYTMLTGTLPFNPYIKKGLFSPKQNNSPRFMSSTWNLLPTDVQDLVKIMTANDSNSRCTAAQGLSSTWLNKTAILPLFDCTKTPPVFSGKFQMLKTSCESINIPALQTQAKDPIKQQFINFEEETARKNSSLVVPKLFSFKDLLLRSNYDFHNSPIDESDIINSEENNGIMNKMKYFCILPIKKKPH